MPRKLNREEVFRYWVEVRELATGSVRKLPLMPVRLVCLEGGKKNELRARLRDKYPDAAFERTLHYVRDHEAAERREEACTSSYRSLRKRQWRT